MAFLEDYKAHVAEREALGVPPLPLSAEQTAEVIDSCNCSGKSG
jgi:aconitate hydratase 2/2-methylisocitrate dehydratase